MRRDRGESRWSVVEGVPMHHRYFPALDHTRETIVLVHGIGVSSRYMIPLAHELRRGAEVLAPDLPGFGRSGTPSRAVGVEELAGVLERWLEVVQVRRPLIVANSFGCQVVTELCARAPTVAAGQVLVGPTVDPFARNTARQALRLIADTVREPPSLVPILAFDYLRFGPRRFWKTWRHALNHRIEDKLRDLSTPTLIVRGERDAIASQAWVEEAARLPQSGELCVIPRAAHAVNFNAPGPLAVAIFGWARRVVTPLRSAHTSS